MADLGFRELQYKFTAHMRNPDRHPAPDGVEDRRLKIYRDLLYNNVEGFMANAFPVLRKLFDDQQWHLMIRDYFAHHEARTGLFPRMPQEFLSYLNEQRQAPSDPPFMRELAHYEWLEAEVMYDVREIGDHQLDAAANLPDGRPIANPIIRPHAYEYPVHRIGPDYQPTEKPPQPTYLVVFRRRNDEVGFMELNAVSARLLELIIGNENQSARQLLEQIAAEMQHPNPQVIIEGGCDILQTFIEKEIVLGTRPQK